MSDDIDWSKAPEGATHYNRRCFCKWLKNAAHPEFFNPDSGKWQTYNPPSVGRDHIAEAVPRPKLPDAAIVFDQKDPDVAATVDFAQAMVRRLGQCRAAGKSGWDDPEQCPPQRLAEGLVRAVRAGKLVDVGNYAMMLWMRTYGRELPPSAPIAGWIGEALERREPVEWDGACLPPVGTVCEWRGHAGEWVPANIAARVTKRSGTSFVLFELPDDYWHWENDPKRLRPILTPEQRAAKERDEAVAAMLAVPEVFHDAQTMQALYDAGYRKTEGE